MWWPRWHTRGEGRSHRCETGPLVQCTTARVVRRAGDELLTKVKVAGEDSDGYWAD